MFAQERRFHVRGSHAGVDGETAKSVSNDIGFAGGVLGSEGVGLQVSEPTKNTATGDSGEFDIGSVKDLYGGLVVRAKDEVVSTEIGTEFANRPDNREEFFFPH